jgi:transposase
LRPDKPVCESLSYAEVIFMIDVETRARIRRLFYVEHWKVGTIARELGLHSETVSLAVETDRFNNTKTLRSSVTDPYADFIREILAKHPRLRATRIFQMIRDRGYNGSIVQLRRFVACIRPAHREAFLRLHTFPGEQGQVDWAHFGEVSVGRARRRLSCFVITLSYSRALYLEFFFDQRLESFLRGHIHAFEDWRGFPRILLYDNLRSVVLERRGDAIHFHPRFQELCAHYHFEARPCQVGAGNQKGRVERVIRYVRESFFAARPFTTLEEFNRQALEWRDREAHRRACPGDDRRKVEDVFTEERPRLLPLPVHPFDSDLLVPLKPGKTIYVRFDLNDYSIPPDAIDKRKNLMLAASDTTIRILDGSTEIARHRRSYDRGQPVLNPDHQEELLKEKHKAKGSTRGSRLSNAVPECEVLLDAAFVRGESASRQTTSLLNLLDLYGARELRAAVCEALERKTPRASSVEYILNQRRRSNKRRVLVPVDLSRYPELENLSVTPHNLETYDDLAKDDPIE